MNPDFDSEEAVVREERGAIRDEAAVERKTVGAASERRARLFAADFGR